jgi:hypothetical protein
MPTQAPKDIESKLVRILNAWETLAPSKSFGGMTLEQYRALVAPSQATRREIEDLADQSTRAIDARDTADEIALGKSVLIINGVRADPTEGEDSSLYAAMGYTRKSERKTGLTRKSHRAPVPPHSA